MNRFYFFTSVLLCTALLGCGQSDKGKIEEPVIQQNASVEIQPGEKIENDFKAFYVYQDRSSRSNHYVPSGFMPDGKCVWLKNDWTEDCRSGSTCIKVLYDVECSKEGQNWAGIYWLNPANNWGTRKGGYNLEGARRLTFWARGEKGGEQIQEFTVGGIAGNYPDSDSAMLGPVILRPEWRQYTIDLHGKDLSYISGGFSWTTSADVNPEGCTFFLDDIRFE